MQLPIRTELCLSFRSLPLQKVYLNLDGLLKLPQYYVFRQDHFQNHSQLFFLKSLKIYMFSHFYVGEKVVSTPIGFGIIFKPFPGIDGRI